MKSARAILQKATHKVLVIGGNFAGLAAVKRLVSLNRGDLEIVLVDPAEHFNWTPNVHEILSGVKSPDSVEISRQTLLTNANVSWGRESVVGLDTSAKIAHLASGECLPYDACLIACGYQSSLPEAVQTGLTFRNSHDVSQIARAIDTIYSSKKQVAISIIGGGFTGVEALGELLRKYGKQNELKITVFESSERLVKGLPAEISKDIEALTADYPVEFKFNVKVDCVENDEVKLEDGSVYASDVTIWTGGGQLPSFVQDADLAKSSQSGISVTRTLQCQNEPSCFVAGDAANILVGDKEFLAKQSYHAIDTGKHAASNLVKWLRDGEKAELAAFVPQPKPVLLSFGNINTYMVTGDSVIASPLLAATKEAIYQVNMYKLFQPLSFTQRKQGLVSRLTSSAHALLLPELRPAAILNVLTRSSLLRVGGASDLKPFMAGILSTIAD